MKNVKTMFIMIVSICIVASLGVVLILNTQDAKDKMNDTMSLASVTESGEVVSKELSFESLFLKPGDTESYEIRFTNVMSGGYDFTLEFIETYDGELKNFVAVEIVLGEEPLAEKCFLADYLDKKKTISVEDVELKGNEQVALKIIYSMDSSIGNEANGASAKFNLKLTVEKS